jgi:cell division septation protein DedD
VQHKEVTTTAMHEPGSIRNLERLQEADDERQMPRAVTLALVGLGGAAIAFAALVLGGRTSRTQVAESDPLGELVSQRQHSQTTPEASGAASAAEARAATDLSPRDVTFPQMLSDDMRPPTALAAVRPPGAASTPLAVASSPVPTQPPPPTDRLPVVPLPAQAVLEATPVVTRPRDALTKAASDAAKLDTPPSAESPAGHEGGYQLQVSSFHTDGEAQAFADQLRARGHHAYVVEAHVPGRGTWFRVRIGPFTTQHAASQYRTDFEAKEHVVPFLVLPESSNKTH